VLCDRFMKPFSDGECQRGSVLFSADLKRADAVKDARHALELAAEERLKLVVAVDSSEDDDDDDDMDDDNEDEEAMDVDGNVTGKLVFLATLRPAHVVQWSNHLGAMCSRE